MSTIKVDTIRNYDSAVDFSQGFKLGGADVIQNYTESADMPETLLLLTETTGGTL